MNRYLATVGRNFVYLSMKGAALVVIVAASTNVLIAADADTESNTLQSSGYWQSPSSEMAEEYVEVLMPPGFQVLATELEGPVFADANGRTLYKWPLENLRNGSIGDRQNAKSVCTNEVMRVTSGFMSPYPPGLVLPHVDTRLSCAEVWPPVLAEQGATPVGKWSIVEREDGAAQWAHDGFPLYVSILDKQPGDVLGGMKIEPGGDGPAVRIPLGLTPALPPEFTVIPMTTGRMVLTEQRYSVYSWEGDEPDKSNCYDSCLDLWTPVLAAETAVGQGKWTVIERSPGVRQWSFWGMPLYTYNNDPSTVSRLGSDMPGWHNVYTQRALTPPESFTIQASRIGDVLADENGKTIYIYKCGDDAFDQLACDHPDTVQEYRLAICGNGDPALCQKTFPYVTAPANATSASRLWSVMTIDPNTGHIASEGQVDAIHVWAYRDRPVYSYTKDKKPGDVNADAVGEFYGYRNGYKAFWLRDDYLSNAFTR